MNDNKIPLSLHVNFIPEKSSLISEKQGDIHLTPNERRLLELVINGKGKKETIIDEIWRNQGTIVGESSYHQLIKMLRRKLHHAGLPGSFIKTIPRYGITVAIPESLNEANDTKDKQNLSSLRKDEDISLQLYSTSLRCDKISPSSENKDRQFLFLNNHKKFIFFMCLAVFIIPLLTVLFIAYDTKAFPYQVNINGVTFHLSSLRNISGELLLKRKANLSKEFNNVYISSNGPGIWIAECIGELSKEKKCRYEQYSLY